MRHENNRGSRTDASEEARSGLRKTWGDTKGMADPEERRLMFKLFSILLQYPDEELVNSVPRLRDGLTHFSEGPHNAGCRSLLQYLESTPLIAL